MCMKKIILGIVAIIMVFSLIACNKNIDEDLNNENNEIINSDINSGESNDNLAENNPLDDLDESGNKTY